MSAQRHAVIVDDERLARRELRSLLESAHPSQVRIVGEAETVAAAAEVTRATDADLIFLDVQLRHESGLDLLPQLDASVAVIFVTAFDQYAVRAFEVNALDYLLKPVEPDRLARAIARLGGDPPPPPAARLGYPDRLFLRVGDRMGFLAVADIVAVTADGDSSKLRMRDGQLLAVRKPLGDWERRLPEREFVRVHRSALVNLEFVERVEDWSHRTYLIYLKGLKEPISMSRRYAAKVRLERS